MAKKEFAAVDIFKFICAIMVMLIHTKPFMNIFWLDAIIGLITRFAVPYFFAISGFFLFYRIRGCEDFWHVVLHWFLRLLRFYTIWFVIVRVVDVLTGCMVRDFGYYLKQYIFTTDGSPLWFINSLIWGMLLVIILSRIVTRKVVVLISVLCLCVGYICSTLQHTVIGIWMTKILYPLIRIIGTQSFLFFAFPYIAMGFFVSNLEINKNWKKDLLLAVVFFSSLAVEAFFIVIKLDPPLTFLWLSAYPMTFFVVLLTLSIELDNRYIYYIFRKISTLFYVLHIVVIQIIRFWFDGVGFSKVDTMNLFFTCLTLVITLILSVGLFYLSKTRVFGWLKYAM